MKGRRGGQSRPFAPCFQASERSQQVFTMAESSTSSATAAPAVPSLTPQGQHAGKPALPLGRPFTLIGSRHRAHLHLLSRSVSKSHAAIISTDAGLYIRDLASREHVYINGKPVKE